MNKRSAPYPYSFFLVCLLGCCLAACSSTYIPTSPTSSAHQATPAQTTATPRLPVTSTSCPAAGTARAMITTLLPLGSDPTIVYLATTSSASSFERYDVTTRKTTVILTLPGASIGTAQVSANGQWILFTNGSKLQVVRVDGQALQTLYCDANSSHFQWSTNQALIAFQSRTASTDSVKILRVADGTLETALSGPVTSNGNLLRTWLDSTHLYLLRYDTDVPPDVLLILDLTKGSNQTVNDLLMVGKPEPGTFQDFDSSYDGTRVFVAHGACVYECSGPGDITVQPALGGRESTIYSSRAYPVVQVRAITRTLLLFTIEVHGISSQNNGDISHNGVWVIHTDGTGLTRLTTDTANLVTNLNADSQYPWSNVSRDGSMYALEQQTLQKSSSSPTGTLLFGSLRGGASVKFASGAQLNIVGWTTM